MFSNKRFFSEPCLELHMYFSSLKTLNVANFIVIFRYNQDRLFDSILYCELAANYPLEGG